MARIKKKRKQKAIKSRKVKNGPELVTYIVGPDIFPWLPPITVVHEK